MEIVFLKIRRLLLSMIFKIKKFLYYSEKLQYKKNISRPLFKKILKEFLKKLFRNSIIVFLLFCTDTKLNFFAIEENTVINTLFSDVLIATVGITGVFLGLYCSNMMSVFTSKYMNAPRVLIDLIEEDVLLNKCIKNISNFLVLSILVLTLNFIGMNVGILLMSYCIINAIIIIISYGIYWKRSFQISDIVNISTPLYSNVSKDFDNISKNSFFCSDINFQNHYKKTACCNIRYIEEIIEYAIETTSAKESAMKLFLIENLNLLEKYWKIKQYIPYDSYWYGEKKVYSKWHRTEDSIIQIAVQTGTSLMVKEEKDYYAIEDLLNSLNKKCLSVLFEDNYFTNLYKWIGYVSNVCASAVKSNCLDIYLQYLADIKRRVCDCISEKRFSNYENQSLVDALMVSYINIVIELRKHIEQLDVCSVLNDSLDICKKRFSKSKSFFWNHEDVEKLHGCIVVEKKIEKRKITPDWYIKQVIAKHIYDYLLDLYVILDDVLNSEIPKLSDFCLKEKHYAETMLIYSRMTELKAKSEVLIKRIEKNIDTLKTYHIEKNIIWKDNSVSNFKEKQDLIFSSLPAKWTICACYFSTEKYEETTQLPDYFGQCYNHLCEFLMVSIEKEDFKSFSRAYENFWNMAFLYQDIIRKDMLSIKEPYLQDSVFNVIANPIIEFGDISGYSYILGEISNKECWKKIVEDKFELILDSMSSDNISKAEICEKIALNFKVKTFTKPAIYNRDIIHTDWKQRFERKIIDSNYLSQIDDNSSELLRNILSETQIPFMMRCDGFEVFAIEVMNKYLDKDKQFKSNRGWERRNNA